MAEGVVDFLEEVEVEEDEGDPVAVAPRALDLGLELADERLVVEQPRQLVMVRLARQLRGRTVEIGDHALGDEAVERVVQAALDEQYLLGPELGCPLGDEAPDHAPQEQELGDDLARGEPERLAVARVLAGLRGERAADPETLRRRLHEPTGELADERRQVAELAEPPEPLQRGKLVVLQPLLDGREREFPGIGLDGRCELFEHLLEESA